MKLARQITGLTGGGSDGWDVFYRSRRMKAEGQPVIELTIGEHDIGTDQEILNAMHAAAAGGHTGYASVSGIAGLRERVARRIEDRTGVPTTPENVQIVPGGQSGLFYAHSAVCDAGDRALYIDPYYATFPSTLRAAGAVPVAVTARADRGFRPDPADIAEKAGDAVSLLINSPNNPTGVVYDMALLSGIAAVAQDKDIWVISDEVYDTQVWDGAHQSIRARPGMAERTLVVGSLSKSHAMTGSRIGWVVGPEEAVWHMGNLATNINYGVAGFIQDAACFALDLGPDFEERIAAPFRRRRALVLELIAGQNVVRAVPSGGAMYVMLDLRATGLSGEDFANRLLDRYLVAVMPGESFGRAAAGHVRVALTVEDAALAEAVGKLLALAGELAGARV